MTTSTYFTAERNVVPRVTAWVDGEREAYVAVDFRRPLHELNLTPVAAMNLGLALIREAESATAHACLLAYLQDDLGLDPKTTYEVRTRMRACRDNNFGPVG